MTTSSKKQTLTEVIKIIREKLGEAKDYLREMEKKKSVPRTFRYRLSAFLSAADSVTEIMWRQGMKYARQKGKGAAFEQWFVGRQDLFRTPEESKQKQGKRQGTDAVWVYLRAARHQTIHIKQINPNKLTRIIITEQLYIRSSSSLKSVSLDGIITEYSEPEEPLPPDAGQTTVQIIDKLFAFNPLQIENHGNVYLLDPPSADVVAVCRDHFKKLELLIEECKTVLK